MVETFSVSPETQLLRASILHTGKPSYADFRDRSISITELRLHDPFFSLKRRTIKREG